ncbi:surfactant protein Bb [Gouania willdenowi]|uniref:Surfactant protein B n=1 Tax=Gouania willdenowi TaxID=441366 RepID=A0A8C5EA96_GOUWI|nr:pulmonary surfactant-associated protein B [Gouania willdenowi]
MPCSAPVNMSTSSDYQPLLLLLVTTALFSGGESRFISSGSFISQKSPTLDTCSQCKQIIQLSANMISSRDSKETVYEALHALCLRLPEDQVPECSAQLKTLLSKILQRTPGHMEPGKTCGVLGLCDAHKIELQKLLHHVSALGEQSKAMVQLGPTCSLCVMIIKKLETLLPKNMTEETLEKLMGQICHLIPKIYKDECKDFVDKYGAAIIEFLLSSAAPHTICTLLHLCLFKEQPSPELPGSADRTPSDCESCRTLAVLSRLHLGFNVSESHTSAFLQSVCELHPHAIPKCEAFTRIYSSPLQKLLTNHMDDPLVCEKADLCVASKHLQPLGQNHCSWGPSYWCKDRETAQECGNQAFCEKHVWKKNK